MLVSSRVKDLSESITLALNAKAMALAEEGRHIYNLTAGQLPFRPLEEFVNLVEDELKFVRSFQYSPVAGVAELRKNIIANIERTRGISFGGLKTEFDCVISNGAKHALSNVLGSLVDPNDEVVMFAPYWVSYPHMVRFARGIPKVVDSSIYDNFTPSIDELRKVLSDRTKVVILNSPNNPTGTHYSEEWMDQFGALMEEFPKVTIVCDEIYFELCYFDPKPTYYYQKRPHLLERTVIIDGISKTLASTGLRIGYCIAPKELTTAITRLQGQTTSGANSLIQRALTNFDFAKTEEYLKPIKVHLRANAQLVREKFREADLSHEWYQSVSAFYYMVNFSRTPLMDKFRQNADDKADYAAEICADLLEKRGLAMVPGSDFGMPNTARISLVMEAGPFKEAMDTLMDALIKGP